MEGAVLGDLVKNSLQKLNYEGNNLVSLGIDGASAVSSAAEGAYGHLKATFAPAVLAMWCCMHRMMLSWGDAKKWTGAAAHGLSATLVDVVAGFLWKMVSHSNLRNEKTPELTLWLLHRNATDAEHHQRLVERLSCSEIYGYGVSCVAFHDKEV